MKVTWNFIQKMVLSIFQRFLDWLKALFFKEEMELSLVGLQYSGKTTFVNVIGKIREEFDSFFLNLLRTSANFRITLNILFSFWKLYGGYNSYSRIQHA